jgi:hypothetical protein
MSHNRTVKAKLQGVTTHIADGSPATKSASIAENNNATTTEKKRSGDIYARFKLLEQTAIQNRT